VKSRRWSALIPDGKTFSEIAEIESLAESEKKPHRTMDDCRRKSTVCVGYLFIRGQLPVAAALSR